MISWCALIAQASFLTLNIGGVNIRSEISVCFQEAEAFQYLALATTPRRILVLTQNKEFALQISGKPKPILATFDPITGRGIALGDTEQRVKSTLGLPTRTERIGNSHDWIYFAEIYLDKKLWEHREVYQFKNGKLVEIRIVETERND